MEQSVVTPRLLYRGAADETAEVCTVDDQAALVVALEAGWRLRRVPAAAAAAGDGVDEDAVTGESTDVDAGADAPVGDAAAADAPTATSKPKPTAKSKPKR